MDKKEVIIGVTSAIGEREEEAGFEYYFKTHVKIPVEKIEWIWKAIDSIIKGDEDEYKIIKDKLDKAIAAYEDENSELTVSERFSMLRWGFVDNAYSTIKYIKKHGIKNPISENKKYIQEEAIKQFSIMEKMYNSELKAAEKSGKKQVDVDMEWLKKIKEGESTMGNVVRDMRDSPNKEKTA